PPPRVRLRELHGLRRGQLCPRAGRGGVGNEGHHCRAAAGTPGPRAAGVAGGANAGGGGGGAGRRGRPPPAPGRGAACGPACPPRLVEVSKDMVPEVEAQIRRTREELEGTRAALDAAESADPVRDLQVTVEAARGALWRLETALEGEDRCLLREALRGVLSR